MGAKCARCTAAQGIDGTVLCWTRVEDVVCLRHRRWTGGSRQLDLTGHDDIIEASRRHRRLIRRHGRVAATRAFNQADNIVLEWTERRTYDVRVDERLHRFHGDSFRILKDDPTVRASRYPSAVALARLLVSPRWTQLALEPDDSTAFAPRSAAPSNRATHGISFRAGGTSSRSRVAFWRSRNCRKSANP
jgi:hypothetical protein